MNGIIPNVYGKTTDNSLIEVIEKSRKVIKAGISAQNMRFMKINLTFK